MLYLFAIEGTPFVKAGYTARCPWQRVCDGFWRLVHPREVCGQLGYESLRLLALSPGTLEDEAVLKDAQPPFCGEFWHEEDAGTIQLFFKVNAIANHGCDNESWELALPAKPVVPPPGGRGVEYRMCCGGPGVQCYGCGARFDLWVHFATHRSESCPAGPGVGAKVACEKCSVSVIKRNLKRHQQSKGCATATSTGSSSTDAVP